MCLPSLWKCFGVELYGGSILTLFWNGIRIPLGYQDVGILG